MSEFHSGSDRFHDYLCLGISGTGRDLVSVFLSIPCAFDSI